MTTPCSPKSCSPGRPRGFDPDRVLDAALPVFWEKGYEATSLTDLTDAMGINRPSLYAAFGNKEGVFLRVMERYGARYLDFLEGALSQKTAAEVIRAMLRGSAEAQTEPGRPPGCLLLSTHLPDDEQAQSLRDALMEQRNVAGTALTARLKRAVAEGDLPADVVPETLAGTVTALCRGMAIDAASGATRAQLLEVAEFSANALSRRLTQSPG
jgi:AcrR family transcriptional regulator